MTTIGVPFELRRRPGAGPVVALFLPARDPAALLELAARQSLDPTGRVFQLAGGYLLQLESPTTGPVPGAIRLRALCEAFYVPADAELIPALLDDEASGLVRDWGLVFLPGGRALWFDRHAPVELSELLSIEPRPGRAWISLPEPRRLADRLTQIALESNDLPPEALYRGYAEELHRGTSLPGPASGREAGLRDQEHTTTEAGSAHQAGLKIGPSAGWGAGGFGLLGGPAGSFRGLVQAALGLFAKGGQAFSALKEKSQWEWIDHSALLRKLVQEFREGDAEKALRRAVPLLGPDEPSRPVQAGRLPWNRAIYSLADLLWRPARGEFVGVPRTRTDVVRELEREYRKAAEKAVRQGDFRRAAYIYGMLLRDHRMAANALKRGGLHHDAAILYLKKLNDPPAAAQSFEAAGEADRAIALYRQVGEHEAAGDLLRRIGDEDSARSEYTKAAELYAGSVPPAYFRAGGLLEHKARRPDQALDYFRSGWEARPGADAVSCALELARIHAERGCAPPIRALLTEAEAFFGSMGSDSDAGAFYNGLVAATGTKALGPFAEEVRDRALLALAARLRLSIEDGRRSASLVSTFLGRAALWPAAVLSDAEYAASACRNRSAAAVRAADRDPRIQGTQVGSGTVTAVSQAPFGGLFLGFSTGAVYGFRPGWVEVVHVADDAAPVSALAAAPEGRVVAALRQTARGSALTCWMRHPDGSFRSRADDRLPPAELLWLTPIVPRGVEYLVGVGDGHCMRIVDAASGMHRKHLAIAPDALDPAVTGLLLPTAPDQGSSQGSLLVLTHNGPHWVVLDEAGETMHPTPYYWQPALPASSTLHSLALTWLHAPPFLELVGLDKNGAVHAAQFYLDGDALELLAARVATTDGGYIATARAGTSTVVAVSRTQIDWLGYRGDRFRVTHSFKLALPTAVACVACPATQETLVVCSDGFVARVATPRRINTARQ
jgi:tetratricopeptide (TPR) repeat protein